MIVRILVSVLVTCLGIQDLTAADKPPLPPRKKQLRPSLPPRPSSSLSHQRSLTITPHPEPHSAPLPEAASPEVASPTNAHKPPLPPRSRSSSSQQHEDHAIPHEPPVTPKVGDTLFIAAARAGNVEQVRKHLLTITRKQLNEQGNNGDTALIAATRLGHLAIVQLLIEARAASGITNKDKHTALIVAIRNNQHACVQALIKMNTFGSSNPDNDSMNNLFDWLGDDGKEKKEKKSKK